MILPHLCDLCGAAGKDVVPIRKMYGQFRQCRACGPVRHWCLRCRKEHRGRYKIVEEPKEQ